MNNTSLTIVISASLLIAAISWAQTPSKNDTEGVRDKIPEAALLTERGQELAERLRRLRRTEATMGSKHPSLAGIRLQIDQLKFQLENWSPEPSPVHADNLPIRAIPTMNDENLRQLVLRLTDDVGQLRIRVERLERQR